MKALITGRLGRQPNASYCSVAQVRSRWSLNFVKKFTILKVSSTALTMTLATCSLFADESQVSTAGRDGSAESSPLKKIDWATFMQQHDMTFDRLPRNWQEAPHFGNAMVGSMLYQAGDTLRLQVFRADVHDHRDDTFGWPAFRSAISHSMNLVPGQVAALSLNDFRQSSSVRIGEHASNVRFALEPVESTSFGELLSDSR